MSEIATNCFSTWGGLGRKIIKARKMKPKRRAGVRADGKGKWRLIPKRIANPPKEKKSKKEGRQKR